MPRRIVIVASLALGLVACATGRVGSDAIVPEPAAAASAAERAGLPAADITRAADLYVTKCAKCHRFYDPLPYSATEWERWMTKMNKKAKLTSEEGDLLRRYLNATRSENAPASATGVGR